MNKKYTLNYTGKFKKDLKLCKKRGYKISLFEKVSRLMGMSYSIRLVTGLESK